MRKKELSQGYKKLKKQKWYEKYMEYLCMWKVKSFNLLLMGPVVQKQPWCFHVQEVIFVMASAALCI